MTILPRALRSGGTIGLMAPSSRVDRDTLAKSCRWLENYGFRAKIHPQAYAAFGQSAGTAAQKAAALRDLLTDPGVDAIMSARGGNRAATMLPDLDDALFARHPKPIIGYSDTTALLNAVTARTGLVTFHGPSVSSFVNGTVERDLEFAFRLLAGGETVLPLWGSIVLNGGSAEGRLAGGNLSSLCGLLGTPWQPDFDGAILFLEDAGDELSRYDRMLIQLGNAGAFAQAAAVIVGDISCRNDSGAVPFGFTVADVLDQHFGALPCPVVRGAPFGHGLENVTLPIGMTARLDAARDRDVVLTLSGPPVVA